MIVKALLSSIFPRLSSSQYSSPHLYRWRYHDHPRLTYKAWILWCRHWCRNRSSYWFILRYHNWNCRDTTLCCIRIFWIVCDKNCATYNNIRSEVSLKSLSQCMQREWENKMISNILFISHLLGVMAGSVNHLSLKYEKMMKKIRNWYATTCTLPNDWKKPNTTRW